MATTDFAVNDSQAVKLWSKELAQAERDTSDIAKLMGEGSDSIIQIKRDFSKGAGDFIKYALRARNSSAGFTENETAIGNASSLTIYDDSFYINELGNTIGVKSKDTIDAQRINFDLRSEAKDVLGEWWKDRKSIMFFNHVCGYLPANTTGASGGPKFNGFNTITAHTSTRRVWAGTATADEGLGTSDTFTVSLIDKAKELAMIGDNMVRPVSVGGQPKFVLYLDPAQVTSLRTNTSTGQWLDITKFSYSGVDVGKNPIYSGALGEYNGVVLRVSQDVRPGVNSSTSAAITTVRRAVMLGAQAAVCGYGKSTPNGNTTYRWSEEVIDHNRKLEVGAWAIQGMKKSVFNSVDYGVVTLSTYAARVA